MKLGKLQFFKLCINLIQLILQKRYNDIVEAYNLEKDKTILEATFEKLIRFISDLSEEEQRNMREGLDEESLALFDLLVKPNLEKDERDKVKKVAVNLLETLKAEKLKVDRTYAHKLIGMDGCLSCCLM